MNPDELIFTLWLVTLFAVFWTVFWFAAYRVWAWRWWWRVLAVLVWMFLGALSSQLRFAPKLGVAGLIDLTLWPVVLLGNLLGAGDVSAKVRLASPDFTVPAGIRAAEVALTLATAVQCVMVWRYLLRRGSKKRGSGPATGAPPPVAGPVAE